MKKLNTLIVMVATAAFASAGTIEYTPGVDITTTYSSDKVWRGADVGQNEAVATVATSLDLPAEICLDLSADYGTVDGTTTTSEEATDLTAVFYTSIYDYLVSLNYTWYSEGFDQSGNGGAQEAGLSVSKDVGPVTLTLTQYVAIEGDNNGYSEFSALYRQDVDFLPTGLDFTAHLGYLSQDAEFTHAELRVTTQLPVANIAIAQPFVAYSADLGGEFIDTFSGDNFFGGIEFKRSF